VLNINWEDFIEKRYFEGSFHLASLLPFLSRDLTILFLNQLLKVDKIFSPQ